MLHFLIKRPIAVSMVFLAVMAIGVLVVINIPVSLLPDVEVPEITVHVTQKNASARSLETLIIGPMRRQLMQVAHLDDIESETRNESSKIKLKFEYGTDISYAFIEVNEKIDQMMSSIPKDVERPKVMKSGTDQIPVFYLNITLKKNLASRDKNWNTSNDKNFLELSAFASNIIRKRIEQLPEVAMVDVSGIAHSEILLSPDLKKIESLNISLDHLERCLVNNHIELGNIVVKEGNYQYNIRFNSLIKTKQDISELQLKIGERLLKLGDLCSVTEQPQKKNGMVISDGKEAITMAIIKQSDAQLSNLEESLNHLNQRLIKDYFFIDFKITRDQTKLLDFSISNLKQDLFWGAIMAFLIMFFFLKDYKSPLLIAVTLPASLITSLVFFYLFEVSINIISLSGLVLGVGMMIDNSIIVIDNISQLKERGYTLINACAEGAREVLVPMVSSLFTTCAVFVPLIFTGGIAGVLFFDEAISLIIGAFVSLAISVTLIPVYYYVLFNKPHSARKNFLSKINKVDYELFYEKSFKYVLRNQRKIWLIVLVFFLAGPFLYFSLPKTKLPATTKDEMVIEIDWNERINIEENKNRTAKLTGKIYDSLSEYTCWIGEQQFILNHLPLETTQANIYLKVKEAKDLKSVEQAVLFFLKRQYPASLLNFKEADNVFNLVISDKEPPLRIILYPIEEHNQLQVEPLKATLAKLKKALPEIAFPSIALEEHTVLRANSSDLINYGLSYEDVSKKLKSSFNARQVFHLSRNESFIPVVMGENQTKLDEALNNSWLHGVGENQYLLADLLQKSINSDFKNIVGGKEGIYFPIDLEVNKHQVGPLMQTIKDTLKADNIFDFRFSGSLFSNEALIKELSITLIISLALLYFILSAQFESLILPLIVLLEIPLDIVAALAFLKIFGSGINLMSLIGIIVMSGIIINDSILKIDTINQLRKQGNSLLKSLILGGKRRLKSILMTSLTTVFAMVPLLFSSGFGTEFQKPLALALIGGMSVGTLASLYLIPLCYYYLKK